MPQKPGTLKLNDKEIADQIRIGDVKAFEQLFNLYYGPLCLFAKKISGDMDKARDIVQEVFVILYTNHKTQQISTSIKSYLFKCVYNACLNSIKQQKVYAGHHDRLKLHLPFMDNNDMMVAAELEEKIRITVEQLPAQCQKIFRMNRYEGKKNSDIAEELNISIRTVETQISKALTTLRAKLIEFLTCLVIAIVIR
jgi:RNA polymerase sigma-70 factor (family 1)